MNVRIGCWSRKTARFSTFPSLYFPPSTTLREEDTGQSPHTPVVHSKNKNKKQKLKMGSTLHKAPSLTAITESTKKHRPARKSSPIMIPLHLITLQI
jgi:hypothetical protein